ncbi:hypothetical protein [Nonomuraea sp. NPDC049695]|uniref:hypothetical protein n=1 Tax=Nonomuraea sp. NPDC049695 TaxID=3154734 RepID=UPI003439AD78
MREFLERLAERESAARAEADRLREQIAELSQRLSAAEQALSRLHVTRGTILEMTGESAEAAPGAAVLSPAYQRILETVEQEPDGPRVRDLCRMLKAALPPLRVTAAHEATGRLDLFGLREVSWADRHSSGWSASSFRGHRHRVTSSRALSTGLSTIS